MRFINCENSKCGKRILSESNIFYCDGCGSLHLNPKEIPIVEHKTEIKYEMLQYFDTLCNFRDKVGKPRMMPSA